MIYPLILTHWGRVTHICVSKLSIIGSDNGLSPGRRQAIIWNNAGILLIRTLGTNSNEILREIHTFSFKKMHLKMSSAKMSAMLSLPQWVKLSCGDLSNMNVIFYSVFMVLKKNVRTQKICFVNSTLDPHHGSSNLANGRSHTVCQRLWTAVRL